MPFEGLQAFKKSYMHYLGASDINSPNAPHVSDNANLHYESGRAGTKKTYLKASRQVFKGNVK